jgi:hypothetical protein
MQIGDIQYPIRSFASFISAIQKDPQVIDVDMLFQIQESCITKIKIIDQKGDLDYYITLVYDIQPD